jgi:putative ABC transport system permease protein
MLAYDVRRALTALRRVPGLALMCVVTLALGIGAAATTFSAVYAALYRPLPFPDPDRLLYLNQLRTNARDGTVPLRWSFPAALDVARSTRSFAAAGTYSRNGVALSASTALGAGGSADAEQVDVEFVSSGYFQAAGIAPLIGRAFSPADDTAARPAAIIGDGLWRRRFGADPAIVGRVVDVNGVRVTIDGVMPPGFAGMTGQAAIWLPAPMAPQLTYRDYLVTTQHFINLIARLKPDVTLAQANAELAAIGPALPHQALDPSAPPASFSAGARRLGDARIDATRRRSLILLLAGSTGLLIVTAINAALLLLARARLRRGEMAIRLALGASRLRLVRELLTESGLIAAAGGVVGILLAGWGAAWLRRAAPVLLPSPQNNYGQIAGFAEPSIEYPIVLFVAALVLLATIAVGVVPAASATRAHPADTLADTSRSLAGRGRGRGLPALAAAQVAVAVLLLSGAMLLVRTVSHLEAGRRDLNERAISFWVNAPASRYAPDAGPQIVERVLARIRQVPGVTEAAVNRCTPYGPGCARALLFLPGRGTRVSDAPAVGRHYVSGSYFRAAGIALRAGRLIDDNDRIGRPAVTVINEAAARRFWPGRNPLGERVWFSSNAGFNDPANPVEVVGVVADVKYWPANEPVGPDFYTSYLQFTYPDSLYIVNAGDVSVVPAIRRAVADVDPSMAIYDVRRLDERVAEAVASPRFTAIATAIFAFSAAALAALGVFGVMAFAVAAQREELALRVALGATPARLRAAVMRRAGAIAVAGGASGIVLSLWLLRAIASALYGVSPADPPTIAIAVATVAACTFAAAAIPAWRASTADPMSVLRKS